MGAVSEVDGLDVLDRDPAEFFAPAPTSLIDGLLAEYQARRAQIDRVGELVAGDLGNVVHHRSGLRFSRILMNPPFSDGRARAHLDAAARLLSTAPGARLVAILPASMRGRAVDSLPGLQLQWSPVFANEFDGCGAAVAILAAVRPEGSSSTTTSTTTEEVTA